MLKNKFLRGKPYSEVQANHNDDNSDIDNSNGSMRRDELSSGKVAKSNVVYKSSSKVYYYDNITPVHILTDFFLKNILMFFYLN